MESYVQKLLNNQQEENRLREEREQMLKRHELELEDVDERMIGVINQRNLIMEEFQKFMANNNNNTNNTNNDINISNLNGKNPLLVINNDDNTVMDDQDDLGVEPKPTTSFITLKIKKPNSSVDNVSMSEKSVSVSTNDDNENNVDNNTKQVTKTNVDSTDNKTVNKSNDPAPKSMNDILKEKTQSGRTLRFLPKLKTSKTAPAIPTLAHVPESPTIELMLNKVRENILDNGTLNKCIDLLSGTKSILINKNKSAKDLNKNEKPDKTDISVKVNDEQVENISMNKQSQPSSPKKRLETPEERRKRIERVLFETKPATSAKPNIGISQLSKSSSALNTIGITNKSIQQQQPQNSRSTIGLNRYVNRNKYRRNHSLSPLRFGQTKRQKSDEQSDPPSPNNSDSSKEFHKCKSEQQLFFEDSSIASFEEESINSSEFDPDKFSIQQEDEDDNINDNIEPEKDDDHLLAPSKVAKQQEAFKQVFFPVDVREKPLMSKKELVQIKKEKTMVKSRSMGWNTLDSTFDHTLGVDHLSHLRRSSVSPEKKQRELELNQLNNTGKFRCYQDFWEKKTTEILAKKQKFEKWQQDTTIGNQSKSGECKTAGGQNKSETAHTNGKKKSLNCSNFDSNVSNNLEKPAANSTLIPNIIQDIKKLEQKSLPSTRQPEKKKSNQNLILNIINDLKSSATNNNKLHNRELTKKVSAINNKTNTKTETLDKVESTEKDLPDKKLSASNGNKCSIKLVTDTENKLLVPEEKFQKSPSPGTFSDSDSEKLIEKLRYFKQDIQRQKMKLKMRQEEQRERQNVDEPLQPRPDEDRQQKKSPTTNENGKMVQQQKEKLDKNLPMVRPDANKSLDLQYLTKHNRQPINRQPINNDPGQTETLPIINRNRIKLTRTYSRDDSSDDANIIDENNNNITNGTTTATTTNKKLLIKTPILSNGNQLNRWKSSNGISLNQTEIMPMRSTYF